MKTEKLLALFLVVTFITPLAAVSPLPDIARAYGMGGAFSAVANDYSTIFYNPAGLGNVKHVELAGTAGRAYTAYPFPQSEFTAAGTLPLEFYRPYWKYGTLGFALHRTGREGDNTVTNFGISFGSSLLDILPKGTNLISEAKNLSTGLTLRMRDVNGPGSGFGAGMDFGLLYKFDEGNSPLSTGWSTALVIQEMNMKSVSRPVIYRLGLAWKNPQSTLSLDYVTEGGVGKFQPGMEIAFFRRLLLMRIGSVLPSEGARQMTLGMGAVLPPIQLDIGYGFQVEKPSKPNDRILVSFTYRFGVPLLAQYFYQERLEKADEVENKVANLESKQETLKTAIRESKELYEAIQSDLELAKSKKDKSDKEIKDLEDQIEVRKQQLDAAERELDQLKEKKAKITRREERVNPHVETRPPFSGEPRKHRVVSGDTLRGIAQKYYGDPNQWQVIYDVNESKILRGAPKEGEELVIP